MKPDIARTAPEIGAALRRRRRSLKLSKVEVAERAGMKQSTVSAAEAGGVGTRLKTIADLMAVLELEFVVRPRSSGRSTPIEDIF
jgi:HTH-type transcriptional regulator/antitoxin HipB